MDKTTRIGIVGCGNISSIYLTNLSHFPNTEVVACADVDTERAAAQAGKFGVPLALTVEELIRHPGIELVINLTPPRHHAEVAFQALLCDKHVYNEKPLCLKRRHARELIGLAKDKKRLLGCAPDTVLGAGIQTCRQLIDDGAIGVPIGVNAFMMSRGPESWHPSPQFFYQKGAGPLFDMGPYYLTTFVYLLGPIRDVVGCARASFDTRIATSEAANGAVIQVETPTHVAGTMSFESGAIGTLVVSFDVAAHRLPCMEVYGSEGSIAVPDPNTFGGPVLLKRRGEADWAEVPLVSGYSANSRGIGAADLCLALEEHREPRTNDRLAYHVLDAMHGLLDSAESGRRIELTSACRRPDPMPRGLQPWQLSV